MSGIKISKQLLIVLAGFFILSSNMVTAEDQNSITGNLTFVTDYVYRGISQNQGNPAIQGGLDYALPGGLYFSLWGSNVSGEIYSKGSMEFDIIAGYSTQIGKTFELDLGLAHFMYPGAEITGPPSDDFDTTEFYIGGTVDKFSFKYSRTLNDWFGVNSDNPFNLAGTAAGSSKGSSYIEASATFEFAKGLSLLVRAGHCKIKNYGDANCTDYGLTVTKTIDDFDMSLAFSTTNANEILYTVDGEDTGDSRVVLSVARNF